MLDQVVSDIYTRVLNAMDVQYPGYVVALENQPFDWNSPPPKYMELEVEFLDSDQVGLTANARTRYVGVIHATCTTRDGQGTLEDMGRLAWLGSQLAYGRVGSAVMQEPKVTTVSAPVGWSSKALSVAFHVDPI